MSTDTATDKSSYGHRLVQILKKLNQGDRLDPKALSDEFGVNLRAIQRDLNERFAFLNLHKVDGRYQMPPALLGKLNLRDVERFTSLAGVRGLFPSLTDDFLRELIDTRVQSALLVKGPEYEELNGSQQILFGQLEDAIRAHQHIAYTYEKADGIKTYQHVEPYKLVNHDGIWYLAAKDDGRLKSFTFVNLDRLQVENTLFIPPPSLHATLPLNMSTTILLGYPLHSLANGPISFSNVELCTKSLNGVYLHFAYLVALGNEPTIALDFFLDTVPSCVRIGEIGALKKYDPDVSNEKMISVVLKEFGESVLLPKPIRTD
ncbi:MAG: WYL domain-containing protein [Burkholderiales bacterium]|nr:WYL domain-containing protein [Burkholderiales bacterium]